MVKGQEYAFPQSKPYMNNPEYVKLNECFRLLAPYAKKAGVEWYNCTPESKLVTIPRMSLTDAICREENEEPIDTEGWYTL